MIYEAVEPRAIIRQGDIFIGIPYMEFNLLKVDVVDAGGDIATADWHAISRVGLSNTCQVPVSSVMAIVVSQDCDASTDCDITLAKIRNLSSITVDYDKAALGDAKNNVVISFIKKNIALFYLPEDGKFGLTEKSAAEFSSLIRIDRAGLQIMTDLRSGRLITVALSHLRNKIAHYFQRYSYNEWYPLSKDEFATYKKRHEDALPYPHQE